MKGISTFVLTATFCAFMAPSLANAAEFDPNYVISDTDLLDKNTMSLDSIQSFLTTKGILGAFVTQDLDGKTKRAADIIHRVSQDWLINPQFILTMLQKEQSLITDTTPKQGQFDWATGYAVCDDCNVDSDGVSRFKGFAKQIDSMAQQFTNGYMADLNTIGKTNTNISTGKVTIIDGVDVVPENDATSSLYTYTPHIHGNKNFWIIWNGWFDSKADDAEFEPLHPTGTLLQNVNDGTVWLIRFGKKQLVKNNAVLLSFFNPKNIIEAEQDILDMYVTAAPLAFPNYSLVRDELGDVYLLVGIEKRKFESADDLGKFGYVPDEIVDTTANELLEYKNGSVITLETAYPQGAVLRHPTSGSLFYADGNKRHAIVTDDILAASYGSWRIEVAKPGELEALFDSSPIPFPEGTFMRVDNNPTVYVVADSKRRPIISEEVFLGLGYQWEDIVWTTPAAVEVHQPESLITLN